MIYKIQFTLLFFLFIFYPLSRGFPVERLVDNNRSRVALHEPDATSNVLQFSLAFLFLLQISYKPVFRIHDILVWIRIN